MPVQQGDITLNVLDVEAPIDLDAPLGDRAVLDGSRDVEVPLVADPFGS